MEQALLDTAAHVAAATTRICQLDGSRSIAS
jgi:hypothetical protein